MDPAELTAMIEAFNLLEPEVQRGVAALVHIIARKNPKIEAANQAAIAAGVDPAQLPKP